MSIFSIVDTVTAEIAAMKLQRQNEQAMIADVEALLGKLATAERRPSYNDRFLDHCAHALGIPPSSIPPYVPPTAETLVEAPAPKPRRGRKPKALADAPNLNAIGKPYSPQYDPNYRMKYRTPKAPNKAGSSSAAAIRNMDDLRAHIKSYWSA